MAFGGFGSTTKFGSTPNTITQATQPPPQKINDRELYPGPTDSITKMEFNPGGQGDFLAVGSWDSQCRIYQIDPSSGESVPKTSISHEGPILSVAWSPDGTKILTSSTDKTCKLTDLNNPTGPGQQIAAHEAPISCVQWLDMPSGNGMNGIAVTAGWDKVIQYWDMRQASPIAKLDAKERVFSMHSCRNLLVFGTADRHVGIVDLAQNPAITKSYKESPLKMQTRTIAVSPSGTRFAIGSVEGRVAVQYVDDKDASSNFSYKCHRQDVGLGTSKETQIYSINSITFNNAHGTCATGGSDGTLSFWDIDQRTRLKTYDVKQLGNGNADAKPPVPATPIVDTTFSKDSNLFAYGLSYDWSKGYTGAIPAMTTKIMLHAVQQDEIKPKPREANKR